MLIQRKHGGVSQGKLGAVLSIIGGLGTLAIAVQRWLETGEVDQEQFAVGWTAVAVGWSLWGNRRAVE